MKKPSITGKGSLDTIILIAGVAVLYFIFKGIQGILEASNIIPDKEEREAKKTITGQTKEEKKPVKVTAAGFTEVTQSGGAFNPNYFKALIRNTNTLAAEKGLKGGVILSTSAGIRTAAKNLYDSVGIFSDDPQQGLAQIRKFKYKSQVSQLSDMFTQTYKRDLYFWLQNKYDTQDQKQALADIVDYVNALPSGGFIFPKNRSINEIALR